MSPQYQSFYNIFDYLNFMHEAINGGLTYEMITITKTRNQSVDGKPRIEPSYLSINYFA